jgi:hypothetical protein
MIRALIVSFGVALAVATTAPVVSAQPAPRDLAARSAARREAIKKRIRALRAYTLTTALQLDEQTAARLFPLLAKWDDVTDRLLVQRVDLTRRLRAADGIDPRTANQLIDEAIANQRAFWDLEDKRLAEIRKMLSPQQTAKLIVVLPEFERKIQNQLKRAIQKRASPGRARQQQQLSGDDDDDIDDDVEQGELPAPQPARSGPPKQAQPCDPYDTRAGCKR